MRFIVWIGAKSGTIIHCSRPVGTVHSSCGIATGRTPSRRKPLMSIEAHASEALSCDWSHYDRNVLVTGGSDGLIRGWDLRKMRTHIFELYSGEFAVRRLACSPHSATVLASANYDFTTRIWDLERGESAQEINAKHTEFVCGLDWNPQRAHELADCGWDSLVNVYTPQCLA
ncbi:peroxisomal targeting signal 2 receptor isoform X2 [Drosophila grimshawi]|uniref:peroxisomal targeting signal 2 receptor isoform X2 n=1 Tax=Drosophila grimshawi TaxID=7222 RepID=UPI001C932B18|nr:peroxisomal targeting signal 2 receptor isoform X2 [Drosophila grimshawi]